MELERRVEKSVEWRKRIVEKSMKEERKNQKQKVELEGEEGVKDKEEGLDKKLKRESEEDLHKGLGEVLVLQQGGLTNRESVRSQSTHHSYQEGKILSGKQRMQETTKEGQGREYVGKTIGRLGTLNWEEWERTGAPQWMVDGIKEGFWWEVQPGLEGKKFPNAQMTQEQMEFVDKVWEEWKAQGC